MCPLKWISIMLSLLLRVGVIVLVTFVLAAEVLIEALGGRPPRG